MTIFFRRKYFFVLSHYPSIFFLSLFYSSFFCIFLLASPSPIFGDSLKGYSKLDLSEHSLALEMPDGARKTLSTILERPEFQPRTEQEDFLSVIKKRVKEWVVTHLQSLLNRFPAWNFEHSSFFSKWLSWLAPLLERIANALRAILKIGMWTLIGSTLIILGYLVYRYLQRRQNQKRISDSIAALWIPPSKSELEDLLRNGRYRETLVALRLSGRHQLETKYSLEPSITDRAVLSKASLVSGGIESWAHAVFMLFEDGIFAGRVLSREGVERLLKDPPEGLFS